MICVKLGETKLWDQQSELDATNFIHYNNKVYL